MFREMRRKKQALSSEENIMILHSCTSGVLAVSGDNAYPYAVPMSYVYHDGKIYFHCALTGHKLDAIAHNNKVSFCVTEKDEVKPGEYTTYYRSVIIFGTIKIISNVKDKRNAIEILAAKYSPEHKEGRLAEIENIIHRLCMLELTIEHMSGKEAVEMAEDR